jgi:ADP-heptose:LPS heptosyltransferase
MSQAFINAQGSLAIISDKQLGDVTLLEPLTRLLAARSGQPCALYVKDAFRPLVELMPQAAWGPDMNVRHDETWATSWSSRNVMRAFKVPAKSKHLLVNHVSRPRWWYRFIFREIKVEPILFQEYWGHYYWRAFGGNDAAFDGPRLNAPPDDWKHPLLPESPYRLINPTAAWPNKFWTAEAWAEIMKSGASSGMPWVMTGGNSEVEKEHCAAIAAAAPQKLINLSGQTSLKQYIHALSRAKSVLCVDGSASHLAQAFAVPTIVIFGPVAPGKWHWTTPCNRAVSAFSFSQARLPATSEVPASAVIEELRSLLAAQTTVAGH